jgi:hypothetical protein
VTGSKPSPLGLRRPLAYSRICFVAIVYSQIAARPVSLSRPFSPTLLFEPTVMNSLAPSGLAITFFVQW